MKVLATCALLGLVSACGPGNSLGGSISQSYSLNFSTVLIEQQGTQLLIEYLENLSIGTDDVCKIVVDTSNLTIPPNSTMNDDTFLNRVTIQRVSNQGGDFPPVDRGQIHFDDFQFKAGGHISGNFQAVFHSGQDVNGDFNDDHITEISTQ